MMGVARLDHCEPRRKMRVTREHLKLGGVAANVVCPKFPRYKEFSAVMPHVDLVHHMKVCDGKACLQLWQDDVKRPSAAICFGDPFLIKPTAVHIDCDAANEFSNRTGRCLDTPSSRPHWQAGHGLWLWIQ